MMHAFVRGEPDRLMAESAAIARYERTCLFTRARPSGAPGQSVIELTIGEAAMTLDDATIERLFRRLVDATREAESQPG